jgi:hypothetical protein
MLNTSISLARTAADCANRICLANANNSTNGAVDTITYSNRSNAAETILVIVDSSTATGGTFDILATLTAIPAGTSCTFAEVYVPDGGTEVGLTTNGFGNEYTTGTNCTFAAGNDRVWSVSIPAGQRGVFRATPDGGSDVLLSVIAGPAANCEGAAVTCLAGENRFSAGTAEVATRYNTGSTAEQVFVVVDQFASTSAGFFNFSAQFDTPPQGDRCDDPIALTSGVATAGDFATFVNDYAGSTGGCPFDSTRADAVYSITVPGNNQVSIAVTPATGMDTSIAIATAAAACNSRTCLVNSDNGGTGVVDTLTVANRTTQPVTYLIIVDHNTVGTATTFSITATVTAAPNGDFCSLSSPLPATPADGETLAGFGNDYGGGGNCSPGSFSGADRVYTATVPPGRTTFIISPDGGTNVSASLIDAPAANCETSPRACISGVDQSTSTGAVERISVSNTGTTNRDVLLVVDTSTTAPGLFSIDRVDGPLVPGEDCDTATDLGDGGVLTGQTTLGFEADLNTTNNGCAGGSGRDRVYRISVPGGRRLTAVLGPDGGFNPVLDLMVGGLDACYRRECSAASSAGGTGAVETVEFTNGGAAPRTVFLSVDSTSFTGASGAGNFDLATTFSPALAGDTCDNAIPVTNGTMLSASTAMNTRDVQRPSDGDGCQSLAGRDLVYSATVPAGQTLTVALTAVMGDPTVNLIAGPASSCRFNAACLAGVDTGGSGGNETLTWTNTGTTSQAVFIVIGNYLSTITTDAAFSMSVTIN